MFKTLGTGFSPLTRIRSLQTLDEASTGARMGTTFQSPDEDSLSPDKWSMKDWGCAWNAFQSPDEDSLSPDSAPMGL